MVTKEQALTCKNFLQISKYKPAAYGNFPFYGVNCNEIEQLDKPARWRANGKCKTWKRNPERFQLPIKYGLYSYGYITEENAHLFIVEE